VTADKTSATQESKIDFLKNYSGRPLKIMEVCGTHTAAIFRSGLRELLPPDIRLISGPGCPVCVTPAVYIDKCIDLAKKSEHVLCSFGDMMKVPGSTSSLSASSASGANIKMIYSPFDVLKQAKQEPGTEFIIAAVGFETTAPAYALLTDELKKSGINNVKLLTALKSAISAIKWVADKNDTIDAFLCPGHVSVITGGLAYRDMAEKHKKPFVVAGFEPAHLINAVYEIVRKINIHDNIDNTTAEPGPAEEVGYLGNLYTEAVSEEGNVRAMEKINEYFETAEAVWRGLGSLAGSAYYLRDEYSCYDAGSRDLDPTDDMPEECSCSEVICGKIDPPDCPLFGNKCTPQHAMGPCMVSTEGACGIWYAD